MTCLGLTLSILSAPLRRLGGGGGGGRRRRVILSEVSACCVFICCVSYLFLSLSLFLSRLPSMIFRSGTWVFWSLEYLSLRLLSVDSSLGFDLFFSRFVFLCSLALLFDLIFLSDASALLLLFTPLLLSLDEDLRLSRDLECSLRSSLLRRSWWFLFFSLFLWSLNFRSLGSVSLYLDSRLGDLFLYSSSLLSLSRLLLCLGVYDARSELS